ncbi:hypothetical protein M011DRAFT_71977 [Sporormia fimetaria CBS 119925]|uniref:Uncharacterized protein n=1 Tax=Sporormia fimetaria CBS 119925 TaxID=1340428 RepID=A0A6A6VA18_9PLEO|nr:hypothetical protein M011DRAFT_71977 [Sporormia fimetaria CBS 119925]
MSDVEPFPSGPHTVRTALKVSLQPGHAPGPCSGFIRASPAAWNDTPQGYPSDRLILGHSARRAFASSIQSCLSYSKTKERRACLAGLPGTLTLTHPLLVKTVCAPSPDRPLAPHTCTHLLPSFSPPPLYPASPQHLVAHVATLSTSHLFYPAWHTTASSHRATFLLTS